MRSPSEDLASWKGKEDMALTLVQMPPHRFLQYQYMSFLVLKAHSRLPDPPLRYL